MAAWPSCTAQNPDAGKKLGSRRRPSADRTKQEVKTGYFVQGSQNGRFINLHNSLKLQNSQKNTKNTKLQKNKQNNFF